MTQIDELVKRLRDHVISRGGQARDENGEIVVQNGAWQMMLDAAAELTRFRERNAELEAELDQAAGVIKDRNAALSSLEAQLEAFRKSAELIRRDHKLRTDGRMWVSNCGFDALMSALRMEGENDG